MAEPNLVDAERWRLKAEEYRVIADGMVNPQARSAFERMAEDCERMAMLAPVPAGPRSAEECLRLAEVCDDFAERFASLSAKRAIIAMGKRWRSLAQDGHASG
jgi:hypothetical protein